MNHLFGNLLENALLAAQKLEKKLRQLRNREEATPRDVADAKAALELYRGIAARHALSPVDLDSRAERARRKKTP